MRIAFAVLFILLLSGSVLAIHDLYYYDKNDDGYTGQLARDRRMYDPNTRERYFGEGYYRPFSNFGAKGPTNRILNTGAKSAYSGVFNLDTNTFSNQGRDPGHISNWDPNVRGFARLDVAVDMLPFGIVDESFGAENVLSQGTARIISQGNAYGEGLNNAYPRTQVFIVVKNFEPTDDDAVYEAWLYDEDTEYALPLGLMQSGAERTSRLSFEIRRMTHMFESVIITRETFPDLDPGPGQIVLMGKFGPTRRDVNPTTSYFSERIR